MAADKSYIGSYGKLRKLLTLASVAVVLSAVFLQFFLGVSRYQTSPMFSIPGISPQTASYVAIILLIGFLVFLALYWKCPKCQCKMFFNATGNKFHYTFDLKNCPECKIPFK